MVEDPSEPGPGGGGRVDKVTVVVGSALTLVGVVGVVVSVMTARPTAATGSVVWLLIGVVVLVLGLRPGGRGRSL